MTRDDLSKLRRGTYLNLELGDGSVLTGWFQGIEGGRVQLETRLLPPPPERRQVPLAEVEAVLVVSRADREELGR